MCAKINTVNPTLIYELLINRTNFRVLMTMRQFINCISQTILNFSESMFKDYNSGAFYLFAILAFPACDYMKTFSNI